ncbi:wax ester/triacylglycerol synthase domain-containing protein [Herbiconiux daphne]|uniref:diacylglycerol O-acyltransferase n=1 Tax=Herbiconiux daphne TaxID=2970914 RepID=A0ABT2H842_9MICO|nr:wax ester/triacylglycerol synthase domain-containing protein [Herbiconiux daphne]MCS5736098.1 WS/DGAT domain-containing protein [Herbiconiux daphne]
MAEEPERLSPDDARILALESSVLTGHTMKLLVLEPGPPLDLDELRLAVAARLSDEPRARQRVETGGAGRAASSGAGMAARATGGDGPRWVAASGFDIAHHVRRRAGAECATEADLRRELSALMSEHLDRDRPLWTLDLLGPLADGTEVIAARLHHAMVDGIAGLRFLEGILLDPHDAPPVDVPPSDAPPHQAAVGASGQAAERSPADEWRRMPAALLRELGHPVARSPFDRPLTSAREVAFVSVPLQGLKDIGASRPDHATVNDVLLAAVAGGLRSWLDAARDGHGSRSDVRAQIPVSLHHRDESAASLGNRDSFINVDLFLGEADPLRRLDRISAHTRTEKQLDDAALLYDLFHALGRLGAAGELAQRAAGSAHEFSVAVSNVPGPRHPVAVRRRRVDRLFSSAEPGAHHVLRIAAISNAGEVGIGFCTDPTALPGIGGLADAVDASYRELQRASGTGDSLRA